MAVKHKFKLVVRLFAFAVIVWMLPLEAILSICYVYVSKDYMTVKDAPSLIKRLGMFDGEAKRIHHETVFPKDCRKAFELGVKLCSPFGEL